MLSDMPYVVLLKDKFPRVPRGHVCHCLVAFASSISDKGNVLYFIFFNFILLTTLLLLNSILHYLRDTLHYLHYTLHYLHYTLYYLHYILHHLHYTLHYLHYTLYYLLKPLAIIN